MACWSSNTGFKEENIVINTTFLGGEPVEQERRVLAHEVNAAPVLRLENHLCMLQRVPAVRVGGRCCNQDLEERQRPALDHQHQLVAKWLP